MTQVTGKEDRGGHLEMAIPKFSALPGIACVMSQHFCLAHWSPPLPLGTSPADLTCEGPQPVHPGVVPKAAPRAVKGDGGGQGRVEEGPCVWSSCMGREAWPAVSIACFERLTQLGQETHDLSCLPVAACLVPCNSSTCGNPTLVTQSFVGRAQCRIIWGKQSQSWDKLWLLMF